MTHRTHATQQDEALRQAQAITSLREHRTRAGLQWIAQRLTSWHPEFTMTNFDREHAAREYARTTYRDDRDANAATWDLRNALPPVRLGDTRAEYAARIQLHLQGVTG
ncbi:MAG: hypothetical protein K0R62_3811 [Nonomuraea muscovyensis]|jgi:hypothetical protein|nr:hypothetical protein [Nonomuraea muscovyensis]